MGISTAINSSLLPQSLVMIQNFLKQDAEQRKEEEKRKRISETAGEITKMFSTLPENATVEQINNVSKQAMMYAFKQDAQESLGVVDPLSKMALGEVGERQQLSQSAAMSKFLGITDTDIAKLPVQTMVEAMKASESLTKDLDVKNAEGQTFHNRYNYKGELVSHILLDPTTTAQKMNLQVQLTGEEAKARATAERLYGYHPDPGKYQYVGTEGGMGVLLDAKRGELKATDIRMDPKANAAYSKVQQGQITQAINTKAQEVLNAMQGEELLDSGFWSSEKYDATKGYYDAKAQKQAPTKTGKFDPTSEVKNLEQGGHIKFAIERGNTKLAELYDQYQKYLAERDAINASPLTGNGTANPSQTKKEKSEELTAWGAQYLKNKK